MGKLNTRLIHIFIYIKINSTRKSNSLLFVCLLFLNNKKNAFFWDIIYYSDQTATYIEPCLEI